LDFIFFYGNVFGNLNHVDNRLVARILSRKSYLSHRDSCPTVNLNFIPFLRLQGVRSVSDFQ
jgi:hypothetical protein